MRRQRFFLKRLFSERMFQVASTAIADEIASVFAYAPIVERIETLDLWLGTLTDTGAEALIQSPAIRKLKKLDLHHHYCSEEMVRRLENMGIEVDASERQEIEEYDEEYDRGTRLYVSLGE